MQSNRSCLAFSTEAEQSAIANNRSGFWVEWRPRFASRDHDVVSSVVLFVFF